MKLAEQADFSPAVFAKGLPFFAELWTEKGQQSRCDLQAGKGAMAPSNRERANANPNALSDDLNPMNVDARIRLLCRTEGRTRTTV